MNQGLQYTVDIVLCIDCTASMTPMLESVKATALGFQDRIVRGLTDKDKHLSALRVRVVAFRDVVDNGPNGLVCSTFFKLPQQAKDFSEFVQPLVPIGNTSYPESGLVALAVAMHSDWESAGDRRRQIIVIWTDDQPNPLETDAAAVAPEFRLLVPASLDALTDLWHDQNSPVSPSAKRLIIFAPDQGAWTTIAESWENTILMPSIAGRGLADHDYNVMLDTIANSV